MSLRGAKRRSNPRKDVENEEIATLPSVARNDENWRFEIDSQKGEGWGEGESNRAIKFWCAGNWNQFFIFGFPPCLLLDSWNKH
jgi:hypothetical protein